jgi:hypothetical protein
VLAALGVGAAAATVGGLLLGARSFLSNLLAELAGFALSVIVAVLVVEKLAEQRRRKRWDFVKEAILLSIKRDLARLIVAARATRVAPGEDIEEAFAKAAFGGALRDAPHRGCPAPDR